MSKINSKWISKNANNLEDSGNDLQVKFSDADAGHASKVWSSDKISTMSGTLSSEIDSDISTHSTSGDHDGRYYTETEVDTISGSLQTNIDAKPDTLLELTDTPSSYDNEKYLKSTASGTEWATVSGEGGSSNHSELNELDYASAGHTGFASTATLTTTSGDIVSQIITGHGDLTGKDGDDHTQYLLTDGSREFSGHLLPEMTGASGTVSARDIGSATQKVRYLYVHDAYIDAGSLYVNNKKVIGDESGTITVSTDFDQDLRIRTTGVGDLLLQSDNEINAIPKGGVEFTVPADNSTKHINFTNQSANGNITFMADGTNAQVQFGAVDEIDLTAPIIDINGDLSVSGTITFGTFNHHSLDGLADDDHTQYLNTTRGDARYYTETELDAGQLDNRYHTESEVTTISGDIVSQIPTDFYTTGEVDDLITAVSGSGGASTLLELTDTPSSYDNEKYLRSTSSGTEWSTVSGGGGSSNHSELNELDYASAGHTGFQPAGDYVTEAELLTTSGSLNDSKVSRDGSTILTADWDIGSGRALILDMLYSRDATQLLYYPTDFTGSLIVGTGGPDLSASGTQGYWNTAVGIGAGLALTTCINNTAVGFNALASNTGGDNNTAIGSSALGLNTTGYDGIAIGSEALFNNISGRQNFAIGYQALYTNETGIQNGAIGYKALYYNTGNYNMAIGFAALYTNTIGNYNVGVGYYSLNLNTDGEGNTGVGYKALVANTTGDNSVAVGYRALAGNTIGKRNIGVGFETLIVNIDGNENAAIGYRSMYKNEDGTRNVALGFASLYQNISADHNVAIGSHALNLVNTGYDNAALGYYAGATLTTGRENTFLGNYAGYHASQMVNAVNTMAIGNGTYTTKHHQIVIGNASIVETVLRVPITDNTPTEDNHLATKLYVDSELTTISGTLQTDIDTKIASVVEDTSPQFGGNLDTNGNDILFGTDTISGTGSMITGDHGGATVPQVVNVIYGTGAPPAAINTTIGTLYIKYTA